MPKVIQSKLDGQPVAFYVTTAFPVNDIQNDRTGLNDPDQLLQVTGKFIEANRTFKAHAHRPLERHTVGTQECWIVLSGRLHAEIFDIDDSKLAEVTLGPGSVLVTYRGGHSLRTGSVSATVIEIKNGPYYGQEKDKRFIEP